MKCIIITGATGFVGANLTRRLLQDGHKIHLLVRPGYSPWRIEAILPDVHLHEVNFDDEIVLTSAVGKIKPDWIFHLAAHGAYPTQTDLRQMVQTNILGTINLIEACLKTGFEAFVNTGSSSEYGFKDYASSETEWLEPNSHYAVTKASATLYCCHTAQSRGVHIPTLRLYSVFGPYEKPTRLMPTLIMCGLKGELPPLVNPDVAHDYVYVEDVIEAYLLSAARPHQKLGAVYNVGAGVQISLCQVVEIARRVMNITVEPVWGTMSNRKWDTNVWVADNRKIRVELGWQPHQTFEQGFRLMVNWFRENPSMHNFYQMHRQMAT